mgnify:CR=1 FL=1
MIKLSRLVFITVFALTSGCASHIQTTSGKSYLEKYDRVETPTISTEEYQDINSLVRQVASVEPTLKFPARIGVARIDAGRLTAIPDKEVEYWEESRRNIGYGFGEFIPVSPLITNMVASAAGLDKTDRVSSVVDKIRLGAARQHLDAVLIYEVYSREQSESNLFAIGDLTIIGAYILPSKSVETQGYANALLIDVVQGYPYGTAEASLEKSEFSSTFGRHDKQQKLSAEIKTEVAAKLVVEVEEMFKDLRIALKK